MESDILKRVGGNIRKHRKDQKCTISELALKAGLAHKYLQSVEVGRKNISIKNLHKVAESLGLDLEDLTRKSSSIAES